MIKNYFRTAELAFVLLLGGIVCDKMESASIQVEIGSALSPNKKSYMQDVIEIIQANKDPAFLLLLCDGEGRQGKEAAEKAINAMKDFYEPKLQALLVKNIGLVQSYFFPKAFQKADQDIQSEYQDGGTTALAVYMKPTTMGVDFFMAWAGDSRALLINMGSTEWDSFIATGDHTPSNSAERERIAKAGGLQPVQRSAGGIWRIGGLPLSRVLGYKKNKDVALGISAEPEQISKFIDRSNIKNTILVMASKGVWNKFTNEEMITLVRDNSMLPATDLAKYIAGRAEGNDIDIRALRNQLSDKDIAQIKVSVDNISVIVVKFALPH